VGDPSKKMLLYATFLLLLAVTHALQTPHYAPSVASRAGVVHANLNTLRAPPAPPPTIGDGGGGGGGGGEPDEYLRLMEVEELQAILADWSSRGKIYHMSDDRWVQERHASGLDTLERMLVDSDGTKEGRRLSLGLFEEDHVWAVAVAEVSVRSGLQVRSLAVNPSQLHVTDSTTYQRMLHAGMCMRGRSPVSEAAYQPMPHGVPQVPRCRRPRLGSERLTHRLVPTKARPAPLGRGDLSVTLVSCHLVITPQTWSAPPGRGDLSDARPAHTAGAAALGGA
jgi:hypothetical protein